jgi:hypothetical protein
MFLGHTEQSEESSFCFSKNISKNPTLATQNQDGGRQIAVAIFQGENEPKPKSFFGKIFQFRFPKCVFCQI